MITLYDDQQKQVSEVRQEFARGANSVLMQASTGAGKTIMASYIIKGALSKNNRSWFIVPRKELMRQTSLTYDKFDIPHSYIASGYGFDAMADSHIVSLQTLPRRLDGLRAPDLAVIDEAHYGEGYIDTLVQWLRYNGTKIIGLSATPKRHDGAGMGKWFDGLVLGTPIKELIELGRLSKYRMFAPDTPDFSNVKVTAGDFQKKSMQNWMDDHGKALIGNAVNTYKQNAMGMLGITFASSIVESKRIADMYKEAGIPAAHLDGTMSADVRRILIQRFADRELLQLVSVDLMTFGFDLAAQVGRDITVECMSDLAPTKSESKQLQKWGRVLRAKENPALIFDHSGNAFAHGMPDADREWSLEGRAKRRRAEQQERTVEMRQCDKCYFCHEPAPKCPNCGHIYPVQSRVIEERDGELVEIQEIERKKQKRMEVGRARSRADLEAIAAERGYARGWVFKMMKLKGIRG